MQVSIEDGYGDVLSKAASGLGLGVAEVASASGLTPARVEAALGGAFDAAEARALAPVLGLGADALIGLGQKDPAPAVAELEGLRGFNTPWPVPGYLEMTVNAYLVWDPAGKVAAAFDSGADAGPIVEAVESLGLRLESVFITHSHGDHVADIRRLRAAGNPRVFAPEAEMSGVREPVRHGDRFRLGALQIEARLTPGHSPGGTSYLVHGLARPLIVVGDAIFCRSIGGVRGHYPAALAAIRREILSLPGETIIAPGHGPLTTVADELAHNPFFACAA